MGIGRIRPCLEWESSQVGVVGARSGDYFDVLLDPALEVVPTLDRLWEAVKRERGVDLARFGQVRVDARVGPWLDRQRAWVETREEAVGIPITWRSGEQWVAELSSSRKKAFRQRARQLERQGLVFHVWDGSEPLDPILDAVIRQKRAWLESRSLDGLLLSDEGADFLRAVTRGLAARGVLHLSMMRSDEGIAACHLGFLHDGVLYYYLPTYDARWKKEGVGTVLLEMLIMWASEHGVRRFDMLLGAHGYKERYPITAEAVQTRVIAVGVAGYAALSAYRLSAKLRRRVEPG